MDVLIKQTNFCHNSEEKNESFSHAVDEWYVANEEKFSFADGQKAIKAFVDALCGKNIPLHGTEGWNQADTAYDYVQRLLRYLRDEGKIKDKDLQETFFNFVLQLSSTDPPSIRVQVIRQCITESDINLEEYVKKLPKDKVKLLLQIFNRKPVEEKGKNEEIYEMFFDVLRIIVDELLSEEQAQEHQSFLVDCAIHFLLDFSHLDEDSLSNVLDLSTTILEKIEDLWKKTTDFASVKGYISRLKDYFTKSRQTPENLERPIRDLIRELSESLGERGLGAEFVLEFHDLAMSVAKTKMKYSEFVKDCFDYSIMFFRELPEESWKKTTGPFLELLQKFSEGLKEINIKFMEDYPAPVTDALEKMFPKNKQHTEKWFGLLMPLLNLRCVSTMEAARSIVDSASGMEWKGKADLAEKVFKAAATVEVPEFKDVTDEEERNDRKEKYVNYFKTFLTSFMEGLKRAKILSNFGTQALQLCTKLLKIASHSEEIQELVEDVSGKIVINLKDPGSKEAMLDTMKTVLGMCKNPDLPWVDCWYFERAIKELVRSCIRPVSDPRLLTDKELAVYISVCEEALRHDVLDPHTGEFCSHHYTVFMEIMDGLSTWLKTLDKYSLATKLMDQIMGTYGTEDESLFALNSRYLGEASECPSGMKLLATQLDKLFALMIETENPDIIQTVYQVYPSNPKSMRKHMGPLMSLFKNSFDDSVISFMSLMLHQAVKSVPEVFTKENSKQILEKCKGNLTLQSSVLPVAQELCKRRPELMVQHISVLMDKSKWQSMLKSWINEMIITLALYDEKLSPKALDYLLEEARVEQDKGGLLSALAGARQIGFKYRDLIKARRSKVEQLHFNDPDAENLKQITLDLIDGKTSEEMMKQFEEQQANIAGLVGRVDENEEAVAEMKNEVNRQGQDLDTVKKDVNVHGQRLDQVEETVEETVAKVEEIDQKTLSHSPYWSRDVAKLLNPATDHDWRLLSSRLGYSNDDIRAWAQQADPCMAMLNEWYATRKTSEATLAILTQLQEMNRQDAAVIVENAMKNAEAVVEDEEFEYASPPPVFISYQWGHQPEARLLQKHLEMAGYQCWLDLGQMGGGDKLFEKIDSGIRAAKVVISCVTEKYTKSPNCNREVNLSVGLNKAMIPLLMEKCTWPPPGSMGPIFSEYLFIRFFQRGGEELSDDRYWPEDKFQELLMQLNAMGLSPDETQIQPVYKNWWMPKVQKIKIDKSKTKDGGKGPNTTDLDKKAAVSPDVFISYQWGKQKNIIQLYERLTGLGLTCWLDIKQMGGGDSLYDKIDRGVRGCRVVVSCVTPKYALSANCRREVSLADALKKPLVPLLLESMQWPPAGPMSMAFTQLLYIDFTKIESEQISWNGVKSQELIDKLNQHVPMTDQTTKAIGSTGKKPATKQTVPKTTQSAPSTSSSSGQNRQPKQEQKPESSSRQPHQQPLQNPSPAQHGQKEQKQPTVKPPSNQPIQETSKKSRACAIM